MQQEQNKTNKRLQVSYSLEKMLPNAGGSVFRLVRLAVARALELADGKPPLIDTIPADKVSMIALEEIAQGRVVYRTNGLAAVKVDK